jgi:iron complex transport system substrate-binding protein
MRKKEVSFVLVFVLILLFAAWPATVCAGETRIVTGLDGAKTVIPSVPKRIACLYNPAYDKIVMLSKGSRIALLPASVTPWAYKFYPELKGIPIVPAGTVPDIERLLKLEIDLILYPKGHLNIASVAERGIAAVCPFNDKFVPSTMAEYTGEFKRQVLFFGEILGPDDRTRAERYCRYLEGITARIGAITSKISEKDKPRIYYGKINDLYSTQGNNTIMKWYTELAGGIYLPKKIQKYFAEVNMERVAAWNPDIILLGQNGSVDSVTNNPAMKTLKAGKSGRVYKVPAGIFYWDMTSCETALLPLFLGKKFHPALFKDWNIVQEMRKFYSDIYDITVTEKDAQRILEGLPPG